MELITKVLLFIHVASGFISIVLFWIPMITKKGNKLHRKSGWLYVYAMWVVVITAALLCIKNCIIGNYDSAIFLGFLSFITAAPLWHGIIILKHKKGLTDKLKKIQLAINIIIVSAAIAMICYNALVLDSRHILMYIFGGLGLTTIPELIRGFKNVSNGKNSIQEHAIGMVTTAIAAYTAFFAFGGRELFGAFLTGNLMIIPWVLPGIMGTIANVYYGRKYASK